MSETKRWLIFDQGGTVVDRYTLFDSKTRSMWGADECPFHPLGFGQYCGELQAESGTDHLGMELELEDLPEETKAYFSQIINDEP
jgi:hypothetical protein